MATTTPGSKMRLKHVWWLVVPLALVLAVLTALVAGTKFNLGSRSFALSIQTLMPNGPFQAEGFFIHTGWDGPTGSFSAGDIYGLKVGNRLLRLDIVDDPIAAAKRKLPATVDELVTALNSRDGWLRLCALERLAELGAAAVPAIPALVKRIENGDEQAAGTLSAVSKSSPDRAVTLLMDALGNSSVDVRWRVEQADDQHARAEGFKILGREAQPQTFTGSGQHQRHEQQHRVAPEGEEVRDGAPVVQV